MTVQDGNIVAYFKRLLIVIVVTMLIMVVVVLVDNYNHNNTKQVNSEIKQAKVIEWMPVK